MTKQPRAFYSLGGLNAETYDIRTQTPIGEIEFYVDRARASGGPVLELGCGTGRVTWPIARAGLPIVGLDRETAMLDQAMRKAEHESPSVRNRARFVRGDMTSFELGEAFGLVIVPFRAFLMLLTIEEQRGSLGAIRRHLSPRGTLIIDIFDPRHERLAVDETAPRVEMQPTRNPATGGIVSVTVLERKTDPIRQLMRERWQFREVAEDGRVLREEEERLELRWMFRYEMHHLLELCGFEVEQEFSDYLGAPPAYGREQIWIATRRG